MIPMFVFSSIASSMIDEYSAITGYRVVIRTAVRNSNQSSHQLPQEYFFEWVKKPQSHCLIIADSIQYSLASLPDEFDRLGGGNT